MRMWEILIYYRGGAIEITTYRMVVESETYPESTVRELSDGGFTFEKSRTTPSLPRGTLVHIPRRAIYKVETSDITPQEGDDAAEA